MSSLSCSLTLYNVVRCSLGVRMPVGAYPVVFGMFGCLWVRTWLSLGRTVFDWECTPDSGTVHGCLWAVRLTMGPCALYDWAHGGNWVRTQ